MSATPLSKTKTSFYRRLYVAYLIDQGVASVPALTEATGMPRRTAQDTITALAELDIDCQFEPGEGERHNIGRYVIRDWGAIDPDWISRHRTAIKTALGYP
ncbi:winged helix-turn-helix domain-containing protein [Halomonas salinarum]|uniref:winged helix-turn-helix domain-containing protein n=1 Tax=Halomonas salinarum TaxID=1158993 RepID=UPI00143C72FA|nr:winged helix-turn-helix domain-containing protein [Halomonas salinarum]